MEGRVAPTTRPAPTPKNLRSDLPPSPLSPLSAFGSLTHLSHETQLRGAHGTTPREGGTATPSTHRGGRANDWEAIAPHLPPTARLTFHRAKTASLFSNTPSALHLGPIPSPRPDPPLTFLTPLPLHLALIPLTDPDLSLPCPSGNAAARLAPSQLTSCARRSMGVLGMACLGAVGE